MNIHEWAARECGMRIIDGIWCDKHDNGILPLGDNCTLNDARYREIVREHFKIETELSRGFYVGWVCYSREEPYFLPNAYSGKTIAEAEINCIEAIREAQK